MRKARLILLSFFLIAVMSVSAYTSNVSMAVETSRSEARTGLDKDLIYFVFPDRYINGDTSNDGGNGFDPTSTAFFHGGDLKGLTGKCESGDNGLARIKNLGFTAVWLTPLVVQQPATANGAGYHGYWGVDFTNVDPHLGTKEDLSSLAECARKLGIKLILDVVTNHTGDVIKYNGQSAYIPEGLQNIKAPEWLNNISNYHNVGEMSRCWGNGACIQLGDFYGLDDVATEKPEVFQGWGKVYGDWIKQFGFVGFRVDTARHVDDNFFKNWSPLINSAAQSSGISQFTTFGEVYDVNPINIMQFIRVNKMQTALDFPFQNMATEFASGYSNASDLKYLFSYDDLYTSPTSSAYNMVTFLGNHDMGRVAFLINSKKVNPASELLKRVQLAHALMYLSRGIPVVYYGDEVGMTGSASGNDQLARQDMFPTQVKIWQTEQRVGSTPIGKGSAFTNADKNPISIYLKQLASLRSKYPALANGQMQIRYASGSQFVFSKLAPTGNREYIVALNNSNKSSKITFPTASNSDWNVLLGSATISRKNSELSLIVPGLTTVVLEAKKSISDTKVKVGAVKVAEDFATCFFQANVSVVTNDLVRVEFFINKQSSNQWDSLGVDLGSPFSVYINPREFNGEVKIKAVVTNSSGMTFESQPTQISIPIIK